MHWTKIVRKHDKQWTDHLHSRQDNEWQAIDALVVQIVTEGQETEIEQNGDDGVKKTRAVEHECHQVLLLSQFGPFVIFDVLDIRFNLLQLFFRRPLRLLFKIRTMSVAEKWRRGDSPGSRRSSQ